MCMPNVGFPLVNDLPTNNVSQSAPIDGVVPVNVCSVVVAVDGSASNQCEPTHLASTPTGSRPGQRPGHRLRGDGGARRDRRRHLHRLPTPVVTLPIGTPGSPGTGITLPITVCGIQVALGGTASASCPSPR